MSIFDRLKRIVVSEIEHRRKGVNTQSVDSDIAQEIQKTHSKFTKQELDYYANLEVHPGASFEEIKTSYKKLAKKYHPDNFHQNDQKENNQVETADQILKKLNEAYNYFQIKHKEKK